MADKKVVKLAGLLKYLWAAGILYLTLKPGVGDSWLDLLGIDNIDKVAHFGLFFVWAVLYFPEALPALKLPPPKAKKFWIVATNSLVLGLLIEIVQSYIPGRTADANDLLADAIGAFVGMGLIKMITRKKTDLN